MTTTRRRLSCELGDRTLHDNSASSMAHGGSLPVLKRPRSAASATLWRWLLASRTSSSFSRWSRCGCSLANAGARCECRMLIAVNVRLQEYFKDSLTDVTSKRLQRLVAHVEGLHRSFKPHKTLSHGDLRLDNMFLLKVLPASHVRVSTSAMAERARRATPSLAARWVLERHRRRRPSRCRT